MKTISLKIDDSIFVETESIVSVMHKPRNRYINEAIDHYNKLNPTVVIVFSDLEMDEPENQPTFPVIWIKVGDSNYAMTPESGSVVQYPMDV